MKIIIFDFEVFKYDTLLGAIIIDENLNQEMYQTWNKDEMIKFYLDNTESVWIGHNNLRYDNCILDAVCNGKNTYEKSQEIINNDKVWSRLRLYSWDLMTQSVDKYSLKVTEAYDGKRISETKVDFHTDRPLHLEERLETESYNRDDLNQSLDNFIRMSDKFSLRLDILNEFNLPLKYLSVTGTKLAAIILKAHQIPGIEKQLIKPKLYDNLKLKNQDVIDFYLNEDFRTDKKIKIQLGGIEQSLGAGGIHGAIKKYHTDKALYFDVSGYYNLIMINYDLLPRTLPPESKELYIHMYFEQLRLKKINLTKRGVYKTILLSVFGGMNNQYTDFYDPQKALLVTITGQIFIIDLMEKLEGLAKVVQSNTDGIIVEPYDWADEDKVIKIVEEWEQRGGFTIKKVHIYDIWQRDVNCYFYKTEENEIHVVGEAVRLYEDWENLFNGNYFDSKEPAIFAYVIINYFLYGKLPEETIEEYKNNLRMFQYICKQKTFDYTEYEETFEDGSIESTRLQGINRAFAYNSTTSVGMIYKCKIDKNGKFKRAKISSIPDNVFVFDDDIRTSENVIKIQQKIDYNYYIKRGYERLTEFVNIPQIKDIKL